MIKTAFLIQIEKHLDLPSAIKDQALRELASHLSEVEEELKDTGMDVAQAKAEAEKRLGNPADIAARLNAAHNTASWKSAILCAVPFIGSAISLMLPWFTARLVLIAVLGVVFAVASIRELVKGRRPVWLAPWLGGAMACAFGLIFFVKDRTIITISLACEPIVPLALIAGWHVRAWRGLILGLCIPVIASGAYYILYQESTEQIHAFPELVIILCSYLLLVLFARSVFEKHSYGSAIQASFFLLTWFTLRLGESERTMAALWLVASAIALVPLIVWLARAPTSKLKRWYIDVSIYIYSLGSAISFLAKYPNRGNAEVVIVGSAIQLILGTMFCAVLLQQIIMAPLNSQRPDSNPDRAAIAQ